MTVDKTKKDITIPGWLFQALITLGTTILAAAVVYGSAKSDLNRAKKDIEVLRQEKVDKEVMNLVLDKLDKIDKKIDTHITRP